MVIEIKKMIDVDFRDFAKISVNAYPGFYDSSVNKIKQLEEKFIELQSIESSKVFYGAFKDQKAVGGMRLYDYKLTLFSSQINAGGIGSVAVDLLHKKEKIGKDLISFSLQHFREKGFPLAVLYPFRPDFYKKMGFGYGTKTNQYRIQPHSFPKGRSKKHLQFVDASETTELLDCYNRVAKMTHGMIQKNYNDAASIFKKEGNSIIGYKEEGSIRGYLVFTFNKVNKNNFLLNNLIIEEIIYENTEVLQELLTFLNSQMDQVNEVIVHTQDEYFHYLLKDVRNGTNHIMPHVYHESNVQGVGIMYRVINTKAIFQQLSSHNFNNANCKLKITINDDFLKENEGSVILYFEDGKVKVMEESEYDVEISLHVSEFTSMLVGSIPFKQLLSYGLVSISDSTYVETVNRIFATDQKPMCTTKF
ncbi:enhanced intracellular survival protein Eis [Cytobacillus sp. IB215316]|uniref:GNAT family N-acetyltransferase n=1 Tax=Cytobacillus sp. IB215316 TaxID=3097354 RepID=UPI002A103FE4|nr:GNAT family N-acetyltransferase [Cytobacillus sp. IB215316]MDX8361299.1 GNAT family N-acetyltransferase [Cytobacillus sp. IB215316]